MVSYRLVIGFGVDYVVFLVFRFEFVEEGFIFYFRRGVCVVFVFRGGDRYISDINWGSKGIFEGFMRYWFGVVSEGRRGVGITGV